MNESFHHSTYQIANVLLFSFFLRGLILLSVYAIDRASIALRLFLSQNTIVYDKSINNHLLILCK